MGMGAVHTRTYGTSPAEPREKAWLRVAIIVWQAACLRNAPVATSVMVARSLVSTHVLGLAGYGAKSCGALVEQ